MTEKEEIPKVLYLYIHSKLYQKTNGSHIISLKDATSFLFQWKIPKRLRALIIKELEMLGKIERVDYLHIEIKRPEVNFEDPEQFYDLQKMCKIVT